MKLFLLVLVIPFINRLISPQSKNNLSPLTFIGVPGDIYIDGLIGVYELNQIDIARFKITLDEFGAWQISWQA